MRVERFAGLLGEHVPELDTVALTAREQATLAQAAEAIALGFRVAVVLRKTENPGAKKWTLPRKWNGVRVVDADKTDLRFLEPAGVYCGLRAKGLAKQDRTGFVHNV